MTAVSHWLGAHRIILVKLDHSPLAILAFEMLETNRTRPRRAFLLGVGLDSDGHKRVTTGANFALVGGTNDTHERMTETAIRVNEKLRDRGRQLHEIDQREFEDIAHEVGLRRLGSEET